MFWYIKIIFLCVRAEDSFSGVLRGYSKRFVHRNDQDVLDVKNTTYICSGALITRHKIYAYLNLLERKFVEDVLI